MPYIASSRTSTGGSTGVNPPRSAGRARGGRARGAARPFADDEAEARTRHLGAALHVVVGRSRRPPQRVGNARLPPLLDDDRVLVAEPVGGRLVWQVRHSPSAASRVASAVASCSSAALSSSFTRSSCSSCSGVGLPSSFCCAAKLVDPPDERAPALVGCEQLVEASAAPRRASAARTSAGSWRAALRSITLDLEALRAPARLLRPSRSRAIQSATAFTRSCAFSTATPNPAHSTSSTSFSPSPNATVSLAGEPECAGEEVQPRALRHARRGRTRGNAAATSRCTCACRSAPSPAPRPRRAPRARRRDELRRRLGQPVEQVADEFDLELLEPRNRARASSLGRRRARRRRRRSGCNPRPATARSLRARARAGSARGGATPVGVDDDRALVADERLARVLRLERPVHDRTIRPVTTITCMPAACAP